MLPAWGDESKIHNVCYFRESLMKHFITILSVLTLFLFSFSAQAQDPQDFVKQYIHDVSGLEDYVVYSDFWRTQTRKYVHDTPEKLAREYKNSRKMHGLFLDRGGFGNPVEVNAWGDADSTTSYTYMLNTSVPNEVMMEYFSQGASNYNAYQITIEQEDGRWVVSGESIVGNYQAF